MMLVGADYDKIVGEFSNLLDDKAAYEKMPHSVNPYATAKPGHLKIPFGI